MHERHFLPIATIINPNLTISYCFKLAHNPVHTTLQTELSGGLSRSDTIYPLHLYIWFSRNSHLTL